MTTMACSFTTHLTSFVVHRVRFGPDSLESGPNPGPGLTYLSNGAKSTYMFLCTLDGAQVSRNFVRSLTLGRFLESAHVSFVRRVE